MSKELPFFKFNATEWITGNISYESFELQGAFISVCAEYWNRNNCLTIEEAKLRLRNSDLVEKLIEKNYLKTKKTFLVIAFLDLERKEITAKRLKLSESGRKGGLSKAKATLKQGSSIKEIDKDKEIDKEVKGKFKRPSVEEINAYCLEENLNLNAQSFIDYYDSNGWKVGKNSMKDWKATARRWAKPKEQTEMVYDPLYEQAKKLGYVK